MVHVIYKGNTFYHIGRVSLKAGVNNVSEADLAYLIAHPHFRQRVNLGIIDVPSMPKPQGKDASKSIEETIKLILKMNDFKILQSIAKYDSRPDVMQAAEERVRQLKDKAASNDLNNKHFKSGD